MSLELTDRQLFEEFISDASEQLYRLDNIISNFNIENIDYAILSEFMRIMHSLKGNSGFVGMMNLSRIAHKLEDLVVDIQNNKIYISIEVVDILFAGAGICRNIIERAVIEPEKNILNERELDLINQIEILSVKPQIIDNVQLETELEKTIGFVKQLKSKNIKIVESEIKELMTKIQSINSYFSKYAEQKINIENKILDIKGNKKYYLGTTDISAQLMKLFNIFAGAKENGGSEKNFNELNGILTELKLALMFEDIYSRPEKIEVVLDMLLNEIQLLKNEMAEVINALSADIESMLLEFTNNLIVFIEPEFDRINEYFNRVKAGEIEYEKLNEFLVNERSAADKSKTIEEIKTQQKTVDKTEMQENQKNKQVESKFIRVAQEKVDSFMTSVGSLIMKSDSLNYFYKIINVKKKLEKNEIQNYRDTITELGDMIYRLQNDLLEIRKAPLSNLFNKFPRLIHDVSKKLNKMVDFKTNGENERIDSYILNELEPVLTHIIRNSLDHGLETVDERAISGKTEKGKILLSAQTTDTELNLKIIDDGRGIDSEKIKKIAIKKQILTMSDAEKMTEEEIINIIFLPGFSSAEKVSDVSGRGVGMDVVLTTLKKLNGRYKITTKVGEGSTIELIIPQITTLVTKESVIVKADKHLIAFEAENIENTMKIKYSDCFVYKNARFIKYYDTVIPIIYLNKIMNLNEFEDKHKFNEDTRVVVYKSKSGLIGILVDAVVNFQSIVIKDFQHSLMTNIQGIKGYTMTGKGDIILILDIDELMSVVSHQSSVVSLLEKVKS